MGVVLLKVALLPGAVTLQPEAVALKQLALNIINIIIFISHGYNKPSLSEPIIAHDGVVEH